MSTYEHDLLTTRFAALAPRPLPGDWDDVLDRAGAVPPRWRRLEPSLRRRGRRSKPVVALAVAVLVAAVAATAYGTVRVLLLDKGFIGLPPVGATPSAPESGDLVVHWNGRSATHARAEEGHVAAPQVRAWVYDDGRMIWSREGRPSTSPIPEGANEFTSGYLEQRLAPEGVELVRSAVAELFDRTRTLLETVPDGSPLAPPRSGLAPPLGYGSAGSVVVPDGERLVRLSWEVGTGGFPGRVPATPEQLSALRRVDALLTDPVSVLPPSAWAVRKIRAYVPSHYAVCIRTSPPRDAYQLLSLLPTRAADVLRDKSRTRSEGDVEASPEGGGPVVVQGRWVTYCSKLATEGAREVADAVSGLDPVPGHTSNVILAYRLAEGTHWWAGTTISFEPYFPHGQVTCSDCG